MYRDVFPTSKMHAEIQMKSGHLFWAKYRQTNEPIDLQDIFNEYWTSNQNDFIVPSRSRPNKLVFSYLIQKCRGCGYWKAPLVSGVPIFGTHYRASPRNYPSQRTNHIPVGGFSTLVTA